ncbi:efflux transporter outer membrane subunit [Ralstonia sp. UNC404CL21Col]|uniref:efflux transporter outer membrane subunit n=1 Tax=Ralstonia sp. UNC404CL21Col TaxID=1380362 RepID=UPI000483138D|nr:efflux transporter outer membrane subunit [Ralstonia sp. UNC404CL21Col]
MTRGTQALRTSLLALAACALVSACAVGPDYKRPTAEVPQQYKEAGDWKIADPSDAIARGKWWEIFNDPQLNALEEQVAAANQNILVAEAQYRQAQALVQSAQASFFPTLGASASATRSRSVRTSVNPDGSLSTGNPSLLNSQSLSLNASWELDLWGRIRRSVESNKASAQASAGDLSSALLSAQATLAQNYFQLRVTDTQKAVLQRTVADYERFLKLTQNQYAVGVAQRSDVLTAQTQLKQSQALLLDTEVTRAQLEHAIAVLIGKPPAEFSLAPATATTVADLPALPAIPLEVPSAVLERRPDIAAAERRMAAANAQIGVAKAAYFPTLTLGASAGLAANTLSRLATLPSRVWSIGPTLAATLFDGGARAAAVDKAGAAYDASVATYRQTVLGAFQDVEDNLAALRWQTQEFGVQADAVKAAQEAAQLNLNRYRAGTVSFLEVITAQATAYSAERTLLTLQGKQYSAAVLLVKALGGGWHGEVPVVGKAALQPASAPAAQ